MNKPFTAHYSAGKFCPFLVQEFPGNNFDLYFPVLVKIFLEILWMGTYLPINHLSAPCSKSYPTPLQLRKQCWAPGHVFHSRLLQLQSCISAVCAAAGTAPAPPHPAGAAFHQKLAKGLRQAQQLPRAIPGTSASLSTESAVAKKKSKAHSLSWAFLSNSPTCGHIPVRQYASK